MGEFFVGRFLFSKQKTSVLNIHSVEVLDVQEVRVGLEQRRDLFVHKLLYLLWAAADEQRKVEQRVHLVVHRLEKWVRGDAFQEVIRRTFFLHTLARSHRVLANRFVELLAVTTGLHARHQDVLRGHERQLGLNVRLDHVRPHLQTVRDVRHDVQDHVRSKKRLWKHHATVGRVVQRALEPLRGVGLRRREKSRDDLHALRPVGQLSPSGRRGSFDENAEDVSLVERKPFLMQAREAMSEMLQTSKSAIIKAIHGINQPRERREDRRRDPEDRREGKKSFTMDESKCILRRDWIVVETEGDQLAEMKEMVDNLEHVFRFSKSNTPVDLATSTLTRCEELADRSVAHTEQCSLVFSQCSNENATLNGYLGKLRAKGEKEEERNRVEYQGEQQDRRPDHRVHQLRPCTPSPECIENSVRPLVSLGIIMAHEARGPRSATATKPAAVAKAPDALVPSADAKKARHRVLVKRAYHQKLNTLNALREQEKALKAQYQKLLKASHARADAQVARGEVASDAGMSVLRDLYVRLTTIREELQKKQRTLQKLAREHEQFQTRLTQIIVAEQQSERALQHATPYVTITPMTEKGCFQVIRKAHKSALSFMESKNTLTLGSEVFGWSHKYRFRDNGSLLQYSISKTFPSLSAFELCQRGWEIMTTQKSYQELHSTSMTSQIHMVQRVNRDNAVLCRILRRKSQKTVFKTLLLASQFQVEKGYMTIYRAIDRERIVSQNLADEHEGEEPHQVVWLDMFAWTYFEDVDDGDGGGVRFEFGGSMQHTSTDNAKFWMMEVLLMALRWEIKAVGPLFTLTP